MEDSSLSILECGETKLFLSNVLTASDPSVIETHKIGAILDCTVECPKLSHPNVTCAKIHLKDMTEQKLFPGLYQAVSFVLQHLNSGIHVLIFCGRGVSRSATLAIACAMSIFDLEFEDAHALVSTKRSIINPNIGFCCSLERIKPQLRSLRVTSKPYKHNPDDNPLFEIYLTSATSEIVVCEAEWTEPVRGPCVMLPVW